MAHVMIPTDKIISDSVQDAKTARLVAIYLFTVFLSIYFLTASGYGISLADVSQARIEVAKSIVERSNLSISTSIGVEGADGRSYSWFGLGPALLTVPLHAFGKWAGIPTESLVALINPVTGAATVVLVFLFSHVLGYARRASLLVAIFYGLGTMAWYYAKAPGDHALETLCILYAVYAMYRHGIDNDVSHLVQSSLALGCAILVRPTSVLALPSIVLLMVMNAIHRRRKARSILRDVAGIVIVLCPFIGVTLWYNYYRFGSVFESGYSLIAARAGLDFFTGTPLLTGLSGFFMSPGKGFFFYAPVTILFFFSLKRFAVKHPYPALSFIVMILIYPFFYAKNLYWHGDWTWGARYIFITTPFYLIPIAAIVDSPIWRVNRLKRVAIYVLFSVSMVIQAASVAVFYDVYFRTLQIEDKIAFVMVQGEGIQPIIEPPPEIYFAWQKSPIPAQLRLVRDIALRMQDYSYAKPPRAVNPVEIIRTLPYMNVIDFWWVYEYLLHRNMTALFAALAMLGIIIYGSLALRKVA
jgi:hypothetical protein